MQSRDGDLGRERLRANAAVTKYEADTTTVPPTIEIQPITSHLQRVRGATSSLWPSKGPWLTRSIRVVHLCHHSYKSNTTRRKQNTMRTNAKSTVSLRCVCVAVAVWLCDVCVCVHMMTLRPCRPRNLQHLV